MSARYGERLTEIADVSSIASVGQPFNDTVTDPEGLPKYTADVERWRSVDQPGLATLG